MDVPKLVLARCPSHSDLHLEPDGQFLVTDWMWQKRGREESKKRVQFLTWLLSGPVSRTRGRTPHPPSSLAASLQVHEESCRPVTLVLVLSK